MRNPQAAAQNCLSLIQFVQNVMPYGSISFADAFLCMHLLFVNFCSVHFCVTLCIPPSLTTPLIVHMCVLCVPWSLSWMWPCHIVSVLPSIQTHVLQEDWQAHKIEQLTCCQLEDVECVGWDPDVPLYCVLVRYIHTYIRSYSLHNGGWMEGTLWADMLIVSACTEESLGSVHFVHMYIHR